MLQAVLRYKKQCGINRKPAMEEAALRPECCDMDAPSIASASG